MPEDKSIYDVYRGAGKAAGEYQASLYGIEDVWSGIESAREKAKWKLGQTERTIDTISAGLELVSEVYGGYKAKQEFEGYLGDVSEAKLGARGAYEKVGAEGKAWGEMSMWERMWQTPEYKFGEEILGSGDITVMAQMAKYGYDIETKDPIIGTNLGGKEKAVVVESEDKEIVEDSMYKEGGESSITETDSKDKEDVPYKIPANKIVERMSLSELKSAMLYHLEPEVKALARREYNKQKSLSPSRDFQD
jgi:hypothetical protein